MIRDNVIQLMDIHFPNKITPRKTDAWMNIETRRMVRHNDFTFTKSSSVIRDTCISNQNVNVLLGKFITYTCKIVFAMIEKNNNNFGHLWKTKSDFFKRCTFVQISK